MQIFWTLLFAVSAAGSTSLPWTRWQLVDRSEQCDAKDQGNRLVQTSLTRRKASENVLDKRLYVVGTNHKAGSQLLRNTMHWAFDILGATDSCQYGTTGMPITSKPGFKEECTEHPTPIRFHNHINGPDLTEIRKEAASKGGLRGVMIIRDPLDMLASAYCYHHRGEENNLGLSPDGITEMEPEVGVPMMASYMQTPMQWMTSAHAIADPEMLVVRYEKFTKSSKAFDDTVKEILTHLFGNEITEKQKQQILDAVAVEDVNRGLTDGFSEPPGLANHTNDEEEMAKARDACRLIPESSLQTSAKKESPAVSIISSFVLTLHSQLL
ncbi:unnamed protein product [Durusdinium trenchii]|uniref:Sulfotransferase domain-containing protein n=1 Tax=Durusdinium trenchii TaxID=1381693 RepID=A0ABP0QFG1_9DINO